VLTSRETSTIEYADNCYDNDKYDKYADVNDGPTCHANLEYIDRLLLQLWHNKRVLFVIINKIHYEH